MKRWMVGDERTETEGLTEDECVLQPSDELLTVLHGMTPCRPPFFSVLLSSILLCVRQLLVLIKSLSITYTCSFFALSLFLAPFCSRSFSVCYLPQGINEYLRADRSTAPNPFCPGQNGPHGLHMCYSSSNFLIEIETQFLSFHFYIYAHINETFCRGL